MSYQLLLGNCLERLQQIPAGSIQCCVTSPPYLGLRDYGVEGQIGLEADWREHVSVLVAVFSEVRRVLRPDGTLWLNYGDMYAQSGGKAASPEEIAEDRTRAARNGHYTGAFSGYGGWNRAAGTATSGLKAKDLCGMPWRIAFALQEAGWWLRADCIWAKKNPMPSSVRDRPTVSHEYIFLLTPSARYFYDPEAVRVPLATNEKRTERIQYNGKSARTSAFIPPNPAGRNLWTLQVAEESHNREMMEKCFEWAWTTMSYTQPGQTIELGTVWEIACQAYRGAHFATFPESLAKTAILAGTSEKGACRACGAPWQRQTEPTPEYAQRLGKSYHDHSNDLGRGHRNGKVLERGQATYVTVGWEPTCQCGSGELMPCTVLDPFAGSGTTGVVALKNGRNFIGCELNPDYYRQALERLEAARLGWTVDEVRLGQIPLFEEK